MDNYDQQQRRFTFTRQQSKK